MQVIIYKQDSGLVAVVTPAPEYADQIVEVAVKDVPIGKPFKIVDSDMLPYHLPREDWDFDDATFTDGVGGRVPPETSA